MLKWLKTGSFTLCSIYVKRDQLICTIGQSRRAINGSVDRARYTGNQPGDGTVLSGINRWGIYLLMLLTVTVLKF